MLTALIVYDEGVSFLELILGLPTGFLSKQGDLSVTFAPVWPLREIVPPGVFNVAIFALIVWLLWYVYRRERLSQKARFRLMCLRGTLALCVLLLLNRPMLALTRNVEEPSVLPILLDQSASMGVADVSKPDGTKVARWDMVRQWLDPASPLRNGLARTHQIKLAPFDAGVRAPAVAIDSAELQPTSVADGGSTAIITSLEQVLRETAGQRVAGVVIITDGRETAGSSVAPVVGKLRSSGIKVVSILVGSETAPVNISVDSIVAQEAAFLGDAVNVRTVIRASGLSGPTPVRIKLVNQATGAPLAGTDGKPVEVLATLDADGVTTSELQFLPAAEGRMAVAVVAELDGNQDTAAEADAKDNSRSTIVTVVEAKLAVLYIEGAPRWDFRYLRNELMRDATVDVSTLLTSADADFAQDGDIPLRRFPETAAELLAYDVVLIGDVDPRQFSDAQLSLLSDFVSKAGGGLAMLAGPRFAPHAYRGTVIEAMLPVGISRVRVTEDAPVTDGFRPTLTAAGQASGVFRFFADRDQNARFMAEDLQPLFFFVRDIDPKAGVGEVFAEHPTATNSQGKRTPILTFGRYGSGRTMFLAAEDIWRWRFYRGESVFDTFWVQCLRELARSRKLGQRKASISSDRLVYELGQQAEVGVRVLEPDTASRLGQKLVARLREVDTGDTRPVELLRVGEDATWSSRIQTDRVGRFELIIEDPALGDLRSAIEVIVPRLELANPRIDSSVVARLAADTGGVVLRPEQIDSVPALLPSAARTLAIVSTQPLWNAPVVLMFLVTVLAGEWILRKRSGML